ncbi:MAG TPA: hypothetical protein V6D35_15905 [Candidatus Sericytochromatia bacterium]
MRLAFTLRMGVRSLLAVLLLYLRVNWSFGLTHQGQLTRKRRLNQPFATLLGYSQ